MSNPLDVASALPEDPDWIKELQEQDDPLAVMLRCEEVDTEEGWEPGTAFAQYIARLSERKSR